MSTRTLLIIHRFSLSHTVFFGLPNTVWHGLGIVLLEIDCVLKAALRRLPA